MNTEKTATDLEQREKDLDEREQKLVEREKRLEELTQRLKSEAVQKLEEVKSIVASQAESNGKPSMPDIIASDNEMPTPGSTASSSAPTISEDGKKIIEVDEDLEDIVPIFLENREKELDTLADLISKSDFKGLEIIGHKLAGNAGGYGFDELGNFGSEIETAAPAEDMDTIKTNVDNIKTYLSSIEVKYVA